MAKPEVACDCGSIKREKEDSRIYCGCCGRFLYDEKDYNFRPRTKPSEKEEGKGNFEMS